MNEHRFRGRIAVVVGGATGIGAACTERFVAEGAAVCVGYHDRAPEAAPAATTAAHVDAGDEHAVDALFAHCERERGPADILVYSAGVSGHARAVHELDAADWDATIRTNLTGAFLCARRFLRGLPDGQPGSIVMIGSVLDEMPVVRGAEYAASKAALRGFIACLALESAARGVRVNGIAPSAIVTRLTPDLADPQRRARTEERIPLRRLGRPEEVAAVAAFLCSDEAAYVTGQTLRVDGGLLLNVASGSAPALRR